MTWFGIGRSVRRIEDARFLRGRGRFVDDIHLPHQSFGVVLMSPHAHARIKSVDATEAKVANGVICVLTGGDLIADKLGCLPPLFMPEDYGGPKGYRTCRPLLVTEHVRCVGDRVAFVVAETLAQAQTAAELIHVHYEPLPAVIGLESAIQEDAPRIWQDCPTGNVSFELTFGDQRATDAAFAAAKHVVSLRLRNNRVSANPLEPRAAIGCYEPASDSYTLYTTTQNPHGVRSLVAGTVLKIPEFEASRGRARCWRWVWPEDESSCRRCPCPLGVTALRPAGEVGGDAIGFTGRRLSGARSDSRRRDGARPGWQDFGNPRAGASRAGSVYGRRLRSPDFMCDAIHPQRLRRQGCGSTNARGLYQHGGSDCLSWHRPSRSELSCGTADR